MLREIETTVRLLYVVVYDIKHKKMLASYA